MKIEIKEQILEILQNNNDIYDNCITNVLDNLRQFQDTLEESSVEFRVIETIIDNLLEFENDDLDLLEMQDVLLNFVHRVDNNEFLPVITNRDEVIRFLLSKHTEE